MILPENPLIYNCSTNIADKGFLNYSSDHAQAYGYFVFGEVGEGIDVVDAIAKVKTGKLKGHADLPVEEVSIIEIKEV